MNNKIDKNEYSTCRQCGRIERYEDLNKDVCEHCWNKLEEEIRQAKERVV